MNNKFTWEKKMKIKGKITIIGCLFALVLVSQDETVSAKSRKIPLT